MHKLWDSMWNESMKIEGLVRAFFTVVTLWDWGKTVWLNCDSCCDVCAYNIESWMKFNFSIQFFSLLFSIVMKSYVISYERGWYVMAM